jgi:hypothetical protein
MAAIIVAGTIADKPFNGGLSWARLNWMFGLRKLGFDVYLIEQIAAHRCTDAKGQVTTFEESENLRYFELVARMFGPDHAALVCSDGDAIHGATRADLIALVESADLLVNISGHLRLNWLLQPLRRKAYVDDDPGFTQFWLASGHGLENLAFHDFHFTFGENIGAADCSIPSGEINWRPLRPFVALEHWPEMSRAGKDRFTTVASWRGPYGPVTYQGRTFGLKAHEFRKFIDLPSRAPQTFEIALDIDPADGKDLEALRQNGWHVVDPKTAAADPTQFRRYVQTSDAECSVAKGVYTETNSGWFSDRTVCYLASGKPALVQDTGFSRRYPTGEGLVPFTTLEEAVAGAERIARNYDAHSRAARAIAEECFASDKVLGEFIDAVGVSV